jgi:LmbE family N-acetylglucosaminyl deacetylase
MNDDLPDARRVLAIFAHPDDESLTAGGTLKACAEKGFETIIISLTAGEKGSIAQTGLAARETLGAARRAELQAAGKVLGAGIVECLDYPDGELAWLNRPQIENLLSEKIKRWQPEIIITFGEDGLYWHPDHIAVHELTKSALFANVNQNISPALYYATCPDNLMLDLDRELKLRGMTFNAWGIHPAAFGVPPSTITTRLDVREYLDAKIAALNCHRTQFAEDNSFISLPPDLAEKFLGWEYFIKDNRTAATTGDTSDILREIAGK